MENASNSADFASLAEAKTAFNALQGDLEAAQSLANEAGNKIEALTAELADAKSALDTANAELATVKQAEAEGAAKLEALTAEIAQLKSEAKTAEQKAAEIAANSGVNPVGSTPEKQSNEMTRADFEAKPMHERIKLIKAGTKVV